MQIAEESETLNFENRHIPDVKWSQDSIYVGLGLIGSRYVHFCQFLAEKKGALRIEKPIT